MKRPQRRAEIRRRFRALRLNAGELTQMDAAEKAGLSMSRYWRLENGYDLPDDDEAKALAKAFHTTPDQITQVEQVAS